VSYRVVVYYLVSRRQNKNLLLLSHSFSLCYQDLNICQRLVSRVLSCLIAQCNSATLLNTSNRHFYRYPFHTWVGHKVNFVDRGPILLTVSDLKIKSVSKIDDFVEVFGLFRYLCEQFKTRNPFLF